MSIPRDQIDPDAQKIIKRLVKAHHQAFLVGGCVRDLLLGRTPKDFDIATSATPPQIKDLFRNCRIIGRRFRLAHIFFGSKIIETATFRANPREVEVEGLVEGAEPVEEDLLIRRDNVFGTAEEDARRRDFTMNGLFFDLEEDKVIDYVDGLPDVEARIVRTIGDPDIRFREDPVRILRAIKFAARLGFTIEPSAWHAILRHRGEIPKCAAPRLLEEIYRLLRGGAARRSVELLIETQILELLVPDLAARLAAPGDEEGKARMWRALDLIDARPLSQPPTNAVLLCALVGPFMGRAILDDAERGDPAQLFDDSARPLLTSMHVSRRDFERARLIMLTMRRLWPSKRRRKPAALTRRDFFDEALEVFELLGTVSVGEPLIAEEVARWRRLASETGHEPPRVERPSEGPPQAPRERVRQPVREPAPRPRPMSITAEDPVTGLPIFVDAPLETFQEPEAAHDEPALASDETAKRKRRRRRGGRRHRGSGGEGGESAPPAGTLAAEPSSSS